MGVGDCEHGMQLLWLNLKQECTQHVVSWWYTHMPKFRMPMTKSEDILPDSIHGENIILILRSKVKVINVRDTLYHGDTLMCQTKYDYVKGQKSLVLNTKQCHNPINLTLRSTFQVVSGSWMYLTHPLMVIDQSAKFDMPMSKLTEVTGRTWRHDKSL